MSRMRLLKYSDSQPRDGSGRWASGGQLGEKAKESTAQAISATHSVTDKEGHKLARSAHLVAAQDHLDAAHALHSEGDTANAKFHEDIARQHKMAAKNHQIASRGYALRTAGSALTGLGTGYAVGAGVTGAQVGYRIGAEIKAGRMTPADAGAAAGSAMGELRSRVKGTAAIGAVTGAAMGVARTHAAVRNSSARRLEERLQSDKADKAPGFSRLGRLLKFDASEPRDPKGEWSAAGQKDVKDALDSSKRALSMRVGSGGYMAAHATAAAANSKAADYYNLEAARSRVLGNQKEEEENNKKASLHYQAAANHSVLTHPVSLAVRAGAQAAIGAIFGGPFAPYMVGSEALAAAGQVSHAVHNQAARELEGEKPTRLSEARNAAEIGSTMAPAAVGLAVLGSMAYRTGASAVSRAPAAYRAWRAGGGKNIPEAFAAAGASIRSGVRAMGAERRIRTGLRSKAPAIVRERPAIEADQFSAVRPGVSFVRSENSTMAMTAMGQLLQKYSSDRLREDSGKSTHLGRLQKYSSDQLRDTQGRWTESGKLAVEASKQVFDLPLGASHKERKKLNLDAAEAHLAAGKGYNRAAREEADPKGKAALRRLARQHFLAARSHAAAASSSIPGYARSAVLGVSSGMAFSSPVVGALDVGSFSAAHAARRSNIRFNRPARELMNAYGHPIPSEKSKTRRGLEVAGVLPPIAVGAYQVARLVRVPQRLQRLRVRASARMSAASARWKQRHGGRNVYQTIRTEQGMGPGSSTQATGTWAKPSTHLGSVLGRLKNKQPLYPMPSSGGSGSRLRITARRAGKSVMGQLLRKYSSVQPRDAHGRWTDAETSTQAAKMRGDQADEAIKLATRKGASSGAYQRARDASRRAARSNEVAFEQNHLSGNEEAAKAHQNAAIGYRKQEEAFQLSANAGRASDRALSSERKGGTAGDAQAIVDHSLAAGMHDIAAQRHAEIGNTEMSARHEQLAENHREATPNAAWNSVKRIGEVAGGIVGGAVTIVGGKEIFQAWVKPRAKAVLDATSQAVATPVRGKGILTRVGQLFRRTKREAGYAARTGEVRPKAQRQKESTTAVPATATAASAPAPATGATTVVPPSPTISPASSVKVPKTKSSKTKSSKTKSSKTPKAPRISVDAFPWLLPAKEPKAGRAISAGVARLNGIRSKRKNVIL